MGLLVSSRQIWGCQDPSRVRVGPSTPAASQAPVSAPKSALHGNPQSRALPTPITSSICQWLCKEDGGKGVTLGMGDTPQLPQPHPDPHSPKLAGCGHVQFPPVNETTPTMGTKLGVPEHSRWQGTVPQLTRPPTFSPRAWLHCRLFARCLWNPSHPSVSNVPSLMAPSLLPLVAPAAPRW